MLYDPKHTGDCSKGVHMFMLEKGQLAQPAPSGIYLVGSIDDKSLRSNLYYMGIGRFQVK
jgi:hypothetical protein